ncbi:zinc transport system substrate-binding protein [Loktanella sp. PT4BL]|uniref:metal ABC transporter substrate-binding protein n=1 Tax=Loktanella sp. PT4BL TaxID=2135611 RepID=UPI000D89F2D7|nr:metal ABC transporter substrate-binding protein [Loktanella sp. PT4BL]PXW71038.1 zinc transport system substrate-binding protein [Loktanella sp. PT4BL]
MPLLRPFLAVVLTLLAANPVAAQDRSRVVAVNYPLQYFAERLAGDEAEVIFPVPADVDPSFWRPSIADISTIQSADLILLNGAGFATWVDRVSLPRAKVVNSTAAIEDQFIRTESITHSHGDGDEHSHEGLASYTWLDPILAIAQAEAVAAAITARGIAPDDAVATRLDALRADLAELDRQATGAFDGMQDIAMIATHPRYQYLAQRYGLSISSLEWEAGAMPTEAEQADLVALAAQTGAQVLIWEAAPPAEAFAVAAELGLANIVFPTLAQGVDDQTYIQAIANALTAISEAKP